MSESIPDKLTEINHTLAQMAELEKLLDQTLQQLQVGMQAGSMYLERLRKITHVEG
jgi:hypothetical protein